MSRDAAPACRPGRRPGGARCAARSRWGRRAARSRRRRRCRTSSWALTCTSTSRPVGQRVPGDVGDRLAQHRQELVGDRAPGRPCRPGPTCARRGVKPSTGTYSRTRLRISARSEDRCLSCSSKIVPRIALIVSSSAETVSSSRRATSGEDAIARHALELEPGGEEPLDDHVVQVAGDPLPVGDQGQLAAGRRRPARGPGPARPGRRRSPAAPARWRRGGARCGRRARPARSPGPGGPGPGSTTASMPSSCISSGGAVTSSAGPPRTRVGRARARGRGRPRRPPPCRRRRSRGRAARWPGPPPRRGRCARSGRARPRPVHAGAGASDAELGGRLQPAPAALAEAVGAGVVDDEAGGAGQGLDQLLVLLG